MGVQALAQRLLSADLPRTRWFEHYAATFDTVEINNTFDGFPEERTFAAWAERAPAGFVYAVKASRFLTAHQEAEEPLDRLFTRMRRLDGRLGPVLYQHAAWLALDLQRLEHFLQALPKSVRHVVEFRNSSVGPFIYVRFHGATGQYGVATLAIGSRHGPNGWGRSAPQGWMCTCTSTMTSAGMLRGMQGRRGH